MARKEWHQTLVLSLLLLSACGGDQAQPGLRAEDVEELTITRLATLGDDEGPGILADPWDVDRRKNGEWVVVDFMLPQHLRFFSGDGQFLRALGRNGQGPGELMMPSPVFVLPGDSLAVVDGELGRMTWYSPDLRPCETASVHPRALVSLLPNRDFLIAEPNSGFGLIRVQPYGTRDNIEVEPFPSPPDLGNEWTRRRVLPKQPGHEFWAAHFVQYRLERWNTNGDRLRRIDRTVEWFKPHDDYGQRAKSEGPPSPSIRAIHEDSNGRVWVAIHVPDPKWETAYGAGRGYFLGQERVTDWNAYYDTIIEVIDPRRNRVLASARVEDRVMGFTSSGEFYSYGESESGSPVVFVYSGALPT